MGEKLPHSGLVQQLIERHRRRNIQYRGIFRQNIVHLFTAKQPADDPLEDEERQWCLMRIIRTSGSI
jgi:hypothetical protein